MDEILSEFTGLIRAMGSDIDRLQEENRELSEEITGLEEDVMGLRECIKEIQLKSTAYEKMEKAVEMLWDKVNDGTMPLMPPGV